MLARSSMNNDRQQAFLALKTPCVNLSAVALKFRTKEAPLKDVLRALESVRDELETLGRANRLDPKLAEYAFFPIAQQVFNEAQRLSPRCLEVAAECVTLLVTYGYRQALLPELGRQLLILMSMLAGAGPNAKSQPPTDELKVASFTCISCTIGALTSSSEGAAVFEDQGTRNVVDQLVYLLLEAITDSASDHVQMSASEALHLLLGAVTNRVFLASLLPRTVSALTKALKPDTKARRTQKVLAMNLKVLRRILVSILADKVAVEPQKADEREALDSSWLKATAKQIKNALVQVSRLRSRNGSLVHRALEELCVSIIEQCTEVLVDALPVMLETLAILSSLPDGESARATCKHILLVYPQMLDMLRQSFVDWSQALPRQMQSQDDQTRQMALRRITAVLPLMMEAGTNDIVRLSNLMPMLLNGVTYMFQDSSTKAIELQDVGKSSNQLTLTESSHPTAFPNILLNQESQKETAQLVRKLLGELRYSSEHENLLGSLIDTIVESEGQEKLAALWLAVQLAQSDKYESFLADSFLEIGANTRRNTDLLANLHAVTFPLLASVYDEQSHVAAHWQTQALAMETLVLYVQSFPSDSYRPELVDTLYPVLSFLGSSNSLLRVHAKTALGQIAQSCGYSSTQELLIQNVDYLVNSIAWKLNVYSLSPEAPKVLQMMVHLCGADLLPYLDDLVQSIFAALDSYHGYSEWVELLFSTLKGLVNVSIKEPYKVIASTNSDTTTDNTTTHVPKNRISATKASTVTDILLDLHARKRRKLDFDRPANEPPTEAPHRPWTTALDGPSFPELNPDLAKNGDDGKDNDVENTDSLRPLDSSNEDETKSKLSKSHSLLLSIANSTVPHLASPSSHVRHLLLDLLRDISPLLSSDENTFLPLINAIWPVIVPRLFASDQQDMFSEISERGQGSEQERAYNIVAAAETISVLCSSAGSFMTSRIEDIFQQLVRLFKRTKNEAGLGDIAPISHKRGGYADGQPRNKGTVALRILSDIPTEPRAVSTGEGSSGRQLTYTEIKRTSQGQILEALTELLLKVLVHVSLSLDTTDTIFKLLLPLMKYNLSIRGVLTEHNEDFVWLWDQQHPHTFRETFQPSPRSSSGAKDIVQNTGLAANVIEEMATDFEYRPMPCLRKRMEMEGMRLLPVKVTALGTID